MRLLVCGGRDYSNATRLYQALDAIVEGKEVECVVEGDAKGADRLAGRWAIDRGLTLIKFPADWDTYGKSAGPIRNRQMLKEGKPDLVVAFPGGSGTDHMVRTSMKAGVPVIRVPA